MHRSAVLLLAAILALATGLGLFGIAATLTQVPITVVPSTAAAAAAVERFYAAADATLRTGDATALREAVPRDYVDHAAASAARSGVEGLVRFLAELRTACPDCRLAADEVAVGHDQAAVRVAVHGHRQGMNLGASGDGLPLTWSALDVLRIAGGQVAERWSQGDALSLVAPAVAGIPAELAADPTTLEVSRLILRPGAELPPLAVSGSALLVVEEGALAVRTVSADPTDPGLPVVEVVNVLGQGERLVLAPGLHYTVRNDSTERTTVVVMAIDPVEVLPDRRPTAPRL
jgi:predicted ester cyclase